MAERDLEARIRVLEDIEAIKKLQHRYWRCITKGLWDEVADCFTQDGVADFGPDRKFQGKNAIVRFYKELMAPVFSLHVPQGHSPEIEITSETTARGTWQVDMSNVEARTNKASRVGAMYDDVYAKEKGEWKIKSKKTIYLYRQAVEMQEIK